MVIFGMFFFQRLLSSTGKLVVWGPVVRDSRGTPKYQIPFHTGIQSESKPPGPGAPFFADPILQHAGTA